MKITSFLFKPFDRFSETQLILTGSVLLVMGGMLGFSFNGRFDNFLHFSVQPHVEFWQPITDLILINLVLFVLLYIAGKIYYPKTRAVDIWATCLIGNAPFYLIALTNLNGFLFRMEDELLPQLMEGSANIPSDMVLGLILVSIIGIFLPIWSIVLLYQGFKVAANVKTGRGIVLFIAAILIGLLITLYIPHF